MRAVRAAKAPASTGALSAGEALKESVATLKKEQDELVQKTDMLKLWCNVCGPASGPDLP